MVYMYPSRDVFTIRNKKGICTIDILNDLKENHPIKRVRFAADARLENINHAYILFDGVSVSSLLVFANRHTLVRRV